MEFIVHEPETEETRRELARRVAMVHAQTVVEKLSALSCPAEQKAQLMDAIMAERGDRAGSGRGRAPA